MRGDYSGKSIGINGPLNDFVGKILGLTFYAQEVNKPIHVILAKIRSQLEKGIDVPLLIEFEGVQGKHFVLVMKYRNAANDFHYLIFDPWEGRSEFVNQSSLLAGSMAPLQKSYKI